ncbi:hypothetical protein [[Eubacterium] cellulosolvens]
MVTCSICGNVNHSIERLCSYCGKTLLKPVSGGSVVTKPVPTVNVISPTIQGPSHTSPIGMCRYHPELPAFYICNRCGKSLCRDCSKSHLNLILCPQCYSHLMPSPPPIYPAYGVYR